jgi:predicted Zn finger-like uncharacterized protein
MIVQCDECNAKFRLDDSKVKDGGVKVRCSKCKHVFVVRKEAADETDVDSFLDGLVPSQPDSAREPVNNAPSAESSSPGAAGMSSDMDSFGTSMSEPLQEKDDFDFGEFSFETAPVSAPDVAPVAPPAGEGFDFGELNPDTAHHDTPGTGPAEFPPATDFGFGEFSFEEAPASSPANTTVLPHPSIEFDFDEFTFDEGTVDSQTTVPEKPSPSGEIDFSHLSMDPESDSGPAPFTEPGTMKTAFDFGEFDLDGTSNASHDQNVTEAGTVPDEDEVSDFTPATQQPSPSATEADDFFFHDDISTATSGADSIAGESALPIADAGSTVGNTASDAAKEFDFSSIPGQEFTFETDLNDKPSAITNTLVENDKEPDQSADFSDFVFAPTSREEAKAEAPEPFQEMETHWTEESESLAHDPFDIISDTEMPVFTDDPPPLSIASRRRSSAILPIAVITGVVILVITLAIGGGYYFKEGPAVFNKLGLGFVASWFGAETRNEGKIAIRNTTAQFMRNNEAGEIFVINGEAVNNFDKPRASIQVKATIYGAKGKTLLQKTVYCGNALSKEQLATMPLAEIDKMVANSFGDSLANLAVQPGKGIPFVAVLANVPAGAADFGVEVVGSTVSSK